MKTKIKIFLGILTLTAFANSLPASAENYYDTIDYIECGDIAVITGFEGTPETVYIPGTINGKHVGEIRENAFYKCENLKKIVIPETVTKIGHHAFYKCAALETVEIRGGISRLGEGCFYGCSSLDDLRLPEGLKFIDRYCFYGCESLAEITLPYKLEEIGEYAFAECGSLYSVCFPEMLLNIGDFAFYGCSKLKNVNIPDSVISLGERSVGYFGVAAKPVDDFTITGGDNSLGKSYAQINGLKYCNVDQPETESTAQSAAIAVSIASSAGLMFFRILEKIKHFRRKYEYEY